MGGAESGQQRGRERDEKKSTTPRRRTEKEKSHRNLGAIDLCVVTRVCSSFFVSWLLLSMYALLLDGLVRRSCFCLGLLWRPIFFLQFSQKKTGCKTTRTHTHNTHAGTKQILPAGDLGCYRSVGRSVVGRRPSARLDSGGWWLPDPCPPAAAAPAPAAAPAAATTAAVAVLSTNALPAYLPAYNKGSSARPGCGGRPPRRCHRASFQETWLALSCLLPPFRP